jgi:hypothetical protein
MKWNVAEISEPPPTEEYQKDKMNWLETNNKNKNTRNLHKGTNKFKNGY